MATIMLPQNIAIWNSKLLALAVEKESDEGATPTLLVLGSVDILNECGITVSRIHPALVCARGW